MICDGVIYFNNWLYDMCDLRLVFVSAKNIVNFSGLTPNQRPTI